jgi:hypothetical protein
MPELDLNLEFPDDTGSKMVKVTNRLSDSTLRLIYRRKVARGLPKLTSTFPGKCPQVTNNHSPISLLTSFLGVNPSILCMMILGTG